MTTTQQRRPSVITTQGTRRSRLMVGMVVLGFLIGLLGGWLLFDADDVISVDGSGLSDRHAEMVAMIGDSFAAWQDNEVDSVLAHYADDATFVALDVEYPVADGSLADYVESFFLAPNMERVGPEVVVDDDTVILFHTLSGVIYSDIFDFSSSGDVLIVRHEVTG